METKKITNDEAISLLRAINDLPKEKENSRLPVKFFYALSKNRRKLVNHVGAIQDAVNKIRDEYSKKDKKGNVTIPPERITKYNKEISDFLTLEEDVEFYQYPYAELESELKDIKGVENIYLIFEFVLSEKSPSKNGKPKNK
jgi:hypothetical protein